MNVSDPHIVFAGGGTGGHLFPGLAVAEHLVQELPGVRVSFAGTERELERQHVRLAGFDHIAIPCRSFPRNILHTPRFLADHLAGYWRAGRFLRKEKVATVVGLGSYASVPMARAAIRCGIPVVLLEQNAVPGRATRWLAPSARLVCLAFGAAREYFPPQCRLRVTGNPVRGGFRPPPAWAASAACEAKADGRQPLEASHGRCDGGQHSAHPRLAAGAAGRARTHMPSAARLAADRKPADGEPWPSRLGSGLNGPFPPAPEDGCRSRQLLVLGGSSGAHSLNENMPRALVRLRPLLPGWRIVHQSGPAELEATRQLYAALKLEADIVPFVADMPATLADTALAVTRAGGTAIAELSVAGIPAVLLPYPYAVDDHQRRNAHVVASAGGGVVVDERESAGTVEDRLVRVLDRLLGDESRRVAMSWAMRRIARPCAAREVAMQILGLLDGHCCRVHVFGKFLGNPT